CALTNSYLRYTRANPLLFFFSQLRPPHTSTLFPYTTLFRSEEDNEWYCKAIHRQRIPVSWLPPPYRNGRQRTRSPRHFNRGPSRDRKSTRLNSSHSQISYAVFCLKKKRHSAELSRV